MKKLDNLDNSAMPCDILKTEIINAIHCMPSARETKLLHLDNDIVVTWKQIDMSHGDLELSIQMPVAPDADMLMFIASASLLSFIKYSAIVLVDETQRKLKLINSNLIAETNIINNSVEDILNQGEVLLSLIITAHQIDK